MTKFQEMRLRAVKFQEMTGCGLNMMDGMLRITLQNGAWFSCDIDGQFSCSVGLYTESQWYDRIQYISGKLKIHYFPTLLEAQGWIDPKNALPEHAQNIAFYSQGTWGEFRTYYGYYDERFGGFVSHTDAYVGSPLYWKPLDQFPQP